MILVAGLGNPGAKYAHTRHNIGWRLLDALVEEFRAQKTSCSANAQLYKAGGLLLLRPLTYMNASGEAIAEVARFYRPERIIVLHDEMELAFARLKMQKGGSHGGHNGLKSVQAHCSEYERMRLGIGRPSSEQPTLALMSQAALECGAAQSAGRTQRVLAWVLGEFSAEEEGILQREFIPRARQAAECLIAEGLTPAQNKFH